MFFTKVKQVFYRKKRFLIIILILLASAVVLAAGSLFAGDKAAPELTMDDINDLLGKSREQTKKLQLPADDQLNEDSGLEAAEKLMERFNGSEFQAELHDEQQRLRQTLFKDIIDESLPQDDPEMPEIARSNPEQLYLFISSSVPITTLRNYAVMIDRARATQVSMVLRGFVGGMKKIRPTMEFIGEILKKDPACDFLKKQCDSYQVNIQVDPQLFHRLAIREVPTLAYLPIRGDDPGEMQAEPVIINGDASLDFLLERINQEVKSAELDTLIASLRGGTRYGE